MRFGNIIILLLYLFCSLTLLSINTDSLELLLLKSEGNQKTELLILLADQYAETKQETSLLYSGIASDMLRKNNDPKFVMASYHKLGNIMRMQSKYFLALLYYQKALAQTENAHSDSAKTILLIDIAKMNQYIGNYDQALDNLYESIKISENNQNIDMQIEAICDIGRIYMLMDNYTKALEFTDEAIRLSKNNNIKESLFSIYNNYGLIYSNLRNFDLALEYHQKALDIATKSEDQLQISYSLNNIGLVYITSGNYEMGLNYYKKALDIKLHNNDKQSIVKAYINLSTALLRLGRYDEALIENQKGHVLAKELNLKFLLLYIYEDYYEIYEALGDHEKALENYQLSIAYKDSLFSQTQNSKINEIEIKYENEAKEKELELLREKDKYQNLLTNALIIGLLVLVLVSMLIIRSIILKRKHDKALHEKNSQILRAEIEKKAFEEEKLKGEVEFKSKQLTTHALTMMQKNNILHDIDNLIDRIKKSTKDTDLINELNTQKSSIRHNLKTEKDWDLFKMYFEQVNTDFFDTLLSQCPDLNNYDLRQCALIKLNLNIKESASVLNLSPHTVKSARYRLKKKLKLGADEDLTEFIRKV